MYFAMASSPVVPGPWWDLLTHRSNGKPLDRHGQRDSLRQRVPLITRMNPPIVIKITMTSMSTAAGHVSRMITMYFAMVPSSRWFFDPGENASIQKANGKSAASTPA
jgi:hypothetical protein